MYDAMIGAYLWFETFFDKVFVAMTYVFSDFPGEEYGAGQARRASFSSRRVRAWSHGI